MTTLASLPATQKLQALVGAGILLIGLGLAFGAISIPSAAGYGGVGPNFLPWVVSLTLVVCGVFAIREALTGGFRAMEDGEEAEGEGLPVAAPGAYWPGFVWVSAGLLANAALITTIGFIFSCTLCFVLAVQGLRSAAGQSHTSPAGWVKDVLIGMAISAPVYWAFTQFLAINLPGLTNTGWL
jgi:putative tricarboxylic transport membrane protein